MTEKESELLEQYLSEKECFIEVYKFLNEEQKNKYKESLLKTIGFNGWLFNRNISKSMNIINTKYIINNLIYFEFLLRICGLISLITWLVMVINNNKNASDFILYSIVYMIGFKIINFIRNES